MNEQLKNLKPFNLEAAKAGAKVITGEGLDVEIIKFDILTSVYTICAIVQLDENTEVVRTYTESGHLYDEDDQEDGVTEDNLFMKPTKHTGWINIYSNGCGATTKNNIYCSYNGAFANRSQNCVDTIKIEWEA